MRIAPKYLPLLAAAGSVVALPLVLLGLGLTLASATDAVIFAIACMGLNVLLDRVGLVSFGQGAFFGLAGYAAALSQRQWFPGAIVAPSLVAIVAVAIVAWLAGFLILRRGRAYFAPLTFVLAAMLSAIAWRWSAVTGGESGVTVTRPSALGVDLANPWIYYAVVAVIGLLTALLLWRVHRSATGRVLSAIRENEERARFLGYPVDRYKLFAFTFSAAIAAIAGVLFVFHHRVATPDPLSISFSGALLAMVVIGGMRSFLGPALGALIFVLCRDLLALLTAHWLLIFGLLFVAFVVFAPAGLLGIAERLSTRFRKRKVEGPADTAPAALPAGLANRPPHDGPVLIARELEKRFGGIRAVAGIDIVVEDRTLHALVGPNGAGKTTALDLLSGRYPPDFGFITLAGKPVGALRPDAIARAGMGRSFHTANLFGSLMVEENVRLAVQARWRKRFGWWTSAENLADVNAEAAALTAYLGLAGLERAEAASLSPGQQRLLDIALALATAPRILLLDEPLAGLAAEERVRIAALLKDISRHIPVLLTAHDVDNVREIADVITMMRDGKVVTQADVDAAAAPMTRHVSPSAAGAKMLLRVDKVDASRSKSHILHAVSLDVAEHEIVALLGRNGAGKSTLLKVLAGIVPPAAGAITLAGEDTTRLTSAETARRGIGYVPQGRGLFAGMTVADNLALSRRERLTGAGVHWDDERIIWVFPHLAQRWYTPADDLSRGEQQMVAVARALSGDVRLLLLDEPFEGLSVAITGELFEAFNRLRYEVAMVIADNRLDLALALSDRSVILERGAVTWTGASKLLRDNLDLRRQKLWM